MIETETDPNIHLDNFDEKKDQPVTPMEKDNQNKKEDDEEDEYAKQTREAKARLRKKIYIASASVFVGCCFLFGAFYDAVKTGYDVMTF